MRRALAAVAIRVATLVASLALLCFVLVHTVGDPTRPARVADAVLTSSAGKSLLTHALADAVSTAAPSVPQETADRIAAAAVGDPRLAAAVHTAAAGDGELPLGAVLHDAAVGIDPQLGAAVPAEGLTVPLPGRGLTTRLAPIRDPLTAGWQWGTAVALAAVALAVLVAPRRSPILRRAGSWCVVSSAVGVGIFVALPYGLAASSLGDGAATAAVVLTAAGEGIAGPLTVLLVAGLALLGASLGVRAVERTAATQPRDDHRVAGIGKPPAVPRPAAAPGRFDAFG
jgi:hypothetical protein